MSDQALQALMKIEPDKFGLKFIADAAWEEATRLYNNQAALVLAELREKPEQLQVTRAFAYAKIAQLAEIAMKDEKGFWNALRRVQAGGHF